jgi:brefeldin A-inhibited guanine nucleotide-exchange protein
MIQALRDLVDLFAHYFDTLVRMLDPLLRLLVECICQGKSITRLYTKHCLTTLLWTENDTLARIGTSCLQRLLESNVRKLTPPLWEKIVSTFVQLFQTTTAGQLFDENLRMPLDPDAPESPSESTGTGYPISTMSPKANFTRF